MPSILLVDDSGLFRNAASEVLKRTGCEALSAEGGTEALDVVRRERPAMLVVRAAMKGMTGMDLCRVLKADPAFSRMPRLATRRSTPAPMPSSRNRSRRRRSSRRSAGSSR